MKQDKYTIPSKKQLRILVELGYEGIVPNGGMYLWVSVDFPTVHKANQIINRLLVEMGLGGKQRGVRAHWRKQRV